MRLCVGTSKGIVILDPRKGPTPLMALAEPLAVWCMAQDAADPNVIYAGASTRSHGAGTLACSADGGKSWTHITPATARDEEVWAVAASPVVKDQLFAGTTHARLFRSDDRGRSFIECVAFLKIPGRERWTFPRAPHVPHVRSIAFDPKVPALMYVGVEEGGVFRTRDGGRSFEPLNDGLYFDVHTVAVDARDSHRLYATTGGGFHLSEDGGASWRQITNGINRKYTVPLLVLGADADAIFTAAAAGPPPTWAAGPAGADAIMFRSADRGLSFAPVPADHVWGRGMVMNLRRDPEGGGFFGVINDGTVIRSNGTGVHAIAEKLPPAYDLVTLP
ncbi:MAG TPA: hypothetical protein VEC38_12840 [Candidatus Binataceae bacterium]|nr:hypothetical protein [Candidatus Binataceae bacterium]